MNARGRRRRSAICAAAFPIFAALAWPNEPAAQAPPPPAAQPVGPPAAVLQALDKITGRVAKLTVAPDETVRFGTLSIVVRACRKRPPEEPPESAAFLEIDDARPGRDERRRLFTGWMLASSAAVSALEHPVYDVWVIDCSSASPASSRSR